MCVCWSAVGIHPPIQPMHLPHAFEVHGSNLDHMPHLLTLQDAISAATGHARDIQKLRAVDHVVI